MMPALSDDEGMPVTSGAFWPPIVAEIVLVGAKPVPLKNSVVAELDGTEVAFSVTVGAVMV